MTFIDEHRELLDDHIRRIHTTNYGVYGTRKVWRQLLREGHQVARCTVERRMRTLGLQGARRGKKIRTTMADPGHQRAADLVKRDFTPPRPNTVWVADFTYIHAWCGIVYVAFVVDVYSRGIVGWTATLSKRADLVLDALDMALWRRDRTGRPAGPGLVHHSDAGSQIHLFPLHRPPDDRRHRRLHRHGRRRAGQCTQTISRRACGLVGGHAGLLIKPGGGWGILPQ
ncbi:IS3 family transposase [Nonomuraea sp. NPDC049141]|uniref:IS3 family transposase n=1 Tax=Nonomuraea sp. NPDC049141 TaxID=3155500 RepID=UPI00340D77AF